MHDELRVGIVGLGAVGATHAQALHHVDGVRLTAWSGGEPSSGRDCGWPDASQLSPDDLLGSDDVDVVVLCSPTQFHGAAAITVARSGRHVVVEKPMTLSVTEAEELVSLQEAGPGVVAMVSQRRFESEYATVKELLETGELGEIRLVMAHVPWLRDKAYFQESPWRSRTSGGGGSLVNQGVHSIDLLQWLCGPVHSVTAQAATLAAAIDAEDTMVATIRFASGALGTVATSTATPPGFPATLTIHTSRGRMELGQGEVHSWQIPGVPRPEEKVSAPSGASDPGAIGLAGHVAVWRDVVAAIHERRRPFVDAVEGAKVTRLLCAINEAARTGREVALSDLR